MISARSAYDLGEVDFWSRRVSHMTAGTFLQLVSLGVENLSPLAHNELLCARRALLLRTAGTFTYGLTRVRWTC